MGLDPIMDTESINEGFWDNVATGAKKVAAFPKKVKDLATQVGWENRTRIVNKDIDKIKKLVGHASNALDTASIFLNRQNRSSTNFKKYFDEHKKLDDLITGLNDVINNTSTPQHNTVQPTPQAAPQQFVKPPVANKPATPQHNTVQPTPQAAPQQFVKPPANIANNPSALAAWHRKHNPGLKVPPVANKPATPVNTNPIPTWSQLDKDNEYLNNLYKQQQRAKKKKK